MDGVQPRWTESTEVHEELHEVERRVNKATLKKFKTLLTDKRDEILKKAKQTLEQDMTLDTDDLPDEMDLASSEYLQSFTFRLRGREKAFLEKIQKALTKIDEGNFGVCLHCEEDISPKRLAAVPWTAFCIQCQEMADRSQAGEGSETFDELMVSAA